MGLSPHRRRDRARALRQRRPSRARLPEAGPPSGGARMLSPPLEEIDEARAASDPPQHRRPRRSRWSKSRRHRRRRRVLATVAVVLSVLLIWLAVSLGGALTNPALGSSYGA